METDSLRIYVKKERPKINNPTFHLKKLEKKTSKANSRQLEGKK